uniref:Peroxisome biogenesis factor 2 n=1 Tax=Cyprinus carpio TaxID=7962 RepID=A0A8C1WKH0_CYPCA
IKAYDENMEKLPLSRVLRISQLDAFELDGALEQLVWSQFTQCFQHFKPGLLTPVEPELKALLQLLLWRFTVYSNSATVGQSLLNIRYKNALIPGQKYRPMSRPQKFWFALLTVGEKWLRERSHSLFLNHPAESNARKARKVLSILMGLTKVASLVNFLLGPQGPRDINFQFLNRELLWHGFAEFLIFLLPLINVWKVKASVAALFSPLKELRGMEGSEETHCTECAVCGEWPTMPHSAGCKHVFCYYCLKSHTIADICFTCPKCGVQIGTIEPVRLHVGTELHQS